MPSGSGPPRGCRGRRRSRSRGTARGGGSPGAGGSPSSPATSSAGSAERAGAPSEVLAGEPAAGAVGVAGVCDALDEVDPGGRGVGEVAGRDHVAGVASGGLLELRVGETGPTPAAARSSFTRQRIDCDSAASLWRAERTDSSGQVADAAAGTMAADARPAANAIAVSSGWDLMQIPSGLSRWRPQPTATEMDARSVPIFGSRSRPCRSRLRRRRRPAIRRRRRCRSRGSGPRASSSGAGGSGARK